ncbi:MAG: hypothetical protein IKQ54_08375 [Oscillospiraceae bacterium]|nr:hypothetical protein [Oscillospiraceae bacterium]
MTTPNPGDLSGLPFTILTGIEPDDWEQYEGQTPNDLYQNFEFKDPDTGYVCAIGYTIDDDEFEWLLSKGFAIKATSYRKSNQPSVWQYTQNP